MSKKLIIFCAEYLILLEGVLLAAFAYVMSSTVSGAVSLFLAATLCLLISVLVAKILKVIIHKKRPPQRIEYFEPFDKYAFPSGHSTGLFSVTFFMFMISVMFGCLSLLVTFCVLAGRVKSHVHDVTDMAGGAVVGVCITYLCMPYVLHQFVPYLVNSFL